MTKFQEDIFFLIFFSKKTFYNLYQSYKWAYNNNKIKNKNQKCIYLAVEKKYIYAIWTNIVEFFTNYPGAMHGVVIFEIKMKTL